MMITHDLGVVAEMAQTVAVMYLGRVVEVADVRSLFREPRHPYTRALLASIPRLGQHSKERLNPVSGMVPSPFERPRGVSIQHALPEDDAGHMRREVAEARPRRGGACGQLLPLWRRRGETGMTGGRNLAASEPDARRRLLDVRGLSKHFPITHGLLRRVVGKVSAVDDVSFHVDESETLGLVGESGCGKTSTGRCLVRAIDPSAGQILFDKGDGAPIDVARVKRRHA